ncbi:TRAP transporter substrate-binding protein [Endozoicomonas elysicola]|uniref:C4-dicarboxylate ABC transporter n=1 Tax=Endozoicomonas elysicola TaxID=305900 RepID=A0A081KGY6_9GAMM|nr:TRAP transporter substrate-binding protein [Endozoicomonas elysicola]KEI73412.1 C4-dicarboxylate ABC transporter [Endozoicomonas elysicola]
MKKLVAALSTTMALTAVISTPADAFFGKKDDTVTWKLGHNANTDHIWHETSLKFASLVEEKSNGKMKVEVFPNGQLGSETDMINSVRLGTLDIVLAGETMQNWAPKAAMMAAPYAFRDLDHMNKVLDGSIGREIEQNITDKVGLVPLYYHERAPRNLTTNKDINSINDLNGLVLRVPDVPMFVKTWEVIGAKPTPMALQEVFTSLQQNTIQGQENPYDLISSLGFYEVQKYAYESEHVIQWIYAVAGEKQLNKLPEELQTVVKEAAAESEAYAKSEFGEFIKKARQDLVDRGMEIRPIDKAGLQKIVSESMEDILTDDQFDIYTRIIATN